MDYVRVSSESELIEALRTEGAAVVCGGTDLLVKMRAGIARPRLLVDISRLDALRHLAVDGDGAVLGAAVPVAEVLHSPDVAAAYPLLCQVLRSLGSAQIRSRATLGGNLANASPAADSALPLLAYDAELVLVSAAGERSVPLGAFFRGPGRTVLARGEYIRSIRIPAPRSDWHTFFHKAGRRLAMTIAIASAAALVAVHDRTVVDVRIAVGSVAPTPMRLLRTEAVLRGHRLDPHRIGEAKASAGAEVSPIDDIRATADYRRGVSADLVARFLRRSLG